ncbi:metal-dependent hydrolase family protein [Vibrio mediterranei]|uniref:metal-dependent hydrolase family protein n=1 Tax=Vibrio mediterranei TaxID=689 RepID=UPI00148C2587|nr:amidohydrolase family protein [Vibrio mediterranei]NOI24060.1 amidohydrolase family protein [Vibrio mediterranei]
MRLFNLLSVLLLSFGSLVQAADEEPGKTVLLNNVNIFDGTALETRTGSVLIKNNIIEKVVYETAPDISADLVIDGKGGFLTPGLIDAHSHSVFGADELDVLYGDQSYVQILSSKEMTEMLHRGVTTIRDAGGNSFGLKRAIDEGILEGPRIYPSGPLISQYSGHGDFRFEDPTVLPKEWGGPLAPGEKNGHVMLANGTDQVKQATRNALFHGATQIKLAVTGGVSSFTDPLFVSEFDSEEISAAVAAAADYGTYVMVHSHSSPGIIRAVESGVKSVEHGTLLNEKAAKIMAEKDVYYIPNFEVLSQLKPIYTDKIRKAKLKMALLGLDHSMKMAKKYDLTIGWGTDLLFSYEGRKNQLQDLVLRKQWFESSEIMVQATGNGGKIVALSGKRNPYGKIGVIEEKAMADILIYNKNPVEDVSVVADYENTLSFIMKDGEIIKNRLDGD